MELKEKLDKIINQNIRKCPQLQVYIESDKLFEPFVFSGSGNNQSFHSASVGKMATALVVIRLIERGILTWEGAITSYLEEELLKSLFTYKGVNYAPQVTLTHLLGHMSGINDYFEGITSNKRSLLDQAIEEPHHLFTPDELVNFTAIHQKAVGKPGEKFLYSDTGYILLAKIAEKAARTPFYQLLSEEVFMPLKMKQTGLLFFDSRFKQENLAPVLVKGVDLHLAQSLSIDYAGGGLSTTLEDLARLVKGIPSLITPESYQKMSQFKPYFRAGMFYGLGLMEVRFEKLFFLLKGLPRLVGHLGVLGVHAWIDPHTHDVYIINVGDMSKISASFQVLIQLVMNIQQARKKI